MNKAFKKILERLEEDARFYNSASDVDQNIRSGLMIAKEAVQEVAAEYHTRWILCTIVDHPDNDDDCEVTMLEHGEYIREIGFYTDRWRRASDEAAIEVVAWKEPSTPYQPK